METFIQAIVLAISIVIMVLVAKWGSTAYPFLREFYREIKLQKWKPNYEEIYYFIASNGIIVKTVWYNTQDLRYEFGNCFRTYEDAEIARDKIKELLNKHK